MEVKDNAIAKYEKQRPSIKKHMKHVSQAIELAKSMELESTEDYEQAGFRLAISKDRRGYLEGWKEEVCTPIFRAHKAAVGEFKPAIDGWRECERVLNQKMTEYDRRVEARNRKRVEELRLLAEKEAEQEKKELLDMAAAAESSGDDDRAEELREDAESTLVVPVPVIPSRPPKVEGLRVTERWTFEVEDITKVPDEWVTKSVLGAKVRAEAKRTSGKCKIPGIRVYQERGRTKA